MAINGRKWAKSLGVIALGVWLTSCGDDSLGQLTLSVQSDMKIPDDVDAVRLYVQAADGQEVIRKLYEIGPGKLDGSIPKTIALVPQRDGLNPIRIRLFSEEGSKTRTLREVVLSVPRGKNPLLRMPISWLCEGEINTEGAKEPSEITTSCDDGETCVMGRCVTANVDANDLEEFTLESVYGGGTDGASGTCFDTLACFSAGQGGAAVEVDLTDCSVAAPQDAGENTNLAMVLKQDSDGICGPDSCLIPLDEDPGHFPYFVGWQRDESGQRLRMPPAVCDRLSAGRILGVALTTACETKTPAVPTCGPWSAVTSNPGTFDAQGPKGPWPTQPGGCGDLQASADTGALCVQLEPRIVNPVAGDETLDGVGNMVVELFDGPDADSATLLDRVTQEGVSVYDTATRNVAFADIEAEEVFVRATFFDNPAETTLKEIRLGGAWRSVPDGAPPEAPFALQRVEIAKGMLSSSSLSMQAILRLNLTLRLAEGGDAPFDGGDGPVAWRAYPMPNPGPDDVPTGFSVGSCQNLGGGPAVLPGHVAGAGPHYLVASLNDFNLGVAELPAPGTPPGSLWSGGPGSGDTWDASGAELVLDGEAYLGTATLDLGYAVDPGDTLPEAYHCPGAGTCGDGVQNGGETDIDCGGPCLQQQCPPGKACAGDGDCMQLVCEDRVCLEPTCSDGALNGQETDVDCGGGECGLCELDQACFSGNDCVSGRCITNACQPAT